MGISSESLQIVSDLKYRNMKDIYDSSWDLSESESGNLPVDEEAFENIYAIWEERDWFVWLKDQTSFPFEVERVEDDDDCFFSETENEEPFTLGHKMKVNDIEAEDEQFGIIIKVREGRKVGRIPLCDVEVTSRKDINFWPVREYAVWFANK